MSKLRFSGGVGKGKERQGSGRGGAHRAGQGSEAESEPNKNKTDAGEGTTTVSYAIWSRRWAGASAAKPSISADACAEIQSIKIKILLATNVLDSEDRLNDRTVVN